MIFFALFTYPTFHSARKEKHPHHIFITQIRFFMVFYFTTVIISEKAVFWIFAYCRLISLWYQASQIVFDCFSVHIEHWRVSLDLRGTKVSVKLAEIEKFWKEKIFEIFWKEKKNILVLKLNRSLKKLKGFTAVKRISATYCSILRGVDVKNKKFIR